MATQAIPGILTAAIAAFAVAVLLAGCSNILDKDSTSSGEEKGWLIFSASARAVNTVVPSGFDFSKDTGLTFTLTGTLSGGKSATLGSWSDSADSLAYSLMAVDESILVDTGSWTFRLSVAKDGGEVLYGTKTVQVVAGGNPLDFGVLSEASADDDTRDTSIDVAKGSVSVILSFPAGKAVSAQSIFYSADSDDSEAETAALELSAGGDSDSVVFTKEADRGTYILEIRVYTDEAKEQSTSYTAFVVVAPGLASTAQASLSSLNAQYTVTYNLNGGAFAEGTTVRTSYSPADVFTLPEPEKDYYEFKGWAKSSETTTADYAAGESISVDEDTALYALWTFSSAKLAEYISSLTEDTTVVIRGALANSDLTAINTAIKNGSYKIALDLSETTGLTEIANQQFVSNMKLSGIVIPDSVTSIGEEAFEGCTRLTEVTIGDSVTSIGECAFWNCTGLTSVEIGDSVTSIGVDAFAECKGLTTVVIPDSVTSLGNGVFYNCTGLTSITIPDSVTSIESSAFWGCTGLTSVTIPNSVTSIGSSAFQFCSSLTSVDIPDSVTSIEGTTFYRCTSLTSVTIPDSVTSIKGLVFYGCTGLTNVTIGSGVEKIGQYAFQNCSALTSATFKDTADWYYTTSSSYTNGTALSPTGLADTSTAATYLKSTYSSKYWYKQ